MNDRNILEGTVRVKLKAIVHVNPKHPALLEIVAESEGRQSLADILQGEVEANLEALGYVTHVTVEPV
jgi:hypothetical protein